MKFIVVYIKKSPHLVYLSLYFQSSFSLIVDKLLVGKNQNKQLSFYVFFIFCPFCPANRNPVEVTPVSRLIPFEHSYTHPRNVTRLVNLYWAHLCVTDRLLKSPERTGQN